MADIGIGIDLGTSNCSIAFCRSSRTVEYVPIRNNGLLPSYVSYTPAGVKTGHAAEQQRVENPANTVYQIKRILGMSWNDQSLQQYRSPAWEFRLVEENSDVRIELNLDGQRRRVSPEEITAELLKSLLKLAENYLNESRLSKAVITVPAYFDSARRQATLRAARLSGLQDVTFISEPTAAVLAVDLTEYPQATYILVFDFGGGTLDLSLVKRILLPDNVTEYEVLAVGGNMRLGGMNFDEALLRHVAYHITSQFGVQPQQIPGMRAKLLQQCELAKHTLSNSTKPANIALEIQPGVNFECSITRSEFNGINRDNFSKILPAVRSVLSSGTLSADQVDVVVMVGGSSRMPQVQKILGDHFGQQKVILDVDPDHAIALGAAKSANVNNMREAGLKPIIVWKEITPWCLGVEVLGGQMKVLIRKGKQLPAVGQNIFKLTNRLARSAHIRIYEGDYKRAALNHYLGQLNLSDARGETDEGRIEVVFEYDRSRTLKVLVKGRNAAKGREIILQDTFASSFDVTNADSNNNEPKHLSVAQAKHLMRTSGMNEEFSDLSDED